MAIHKIVTDQARCFGYIDPCHGSLFRRGELARVVGSVGYSVLVLVIWFGLVLLAPSEKRG